MLSVAYLGSERAVTSKILKIIIISFPVKVDIEGLSRDQCGVQESITWRLDRAHALYISEFVHCTVERKSSFNM